MKKEKTHGINPQYDAVEDALGLVFGALEAMGYSIAEQTNWGAAAQILVGPARGVSDAIAGNSPDQAATGRTHTGLFYGAIDSRRPAGAAIGE